MVKTVIPPFYDSLVQFLALSKHQMFAIAADYNLTSMQSFMLLLMHDGEVRTMNSFCGVLGCDASNVTGLVDGLERKKLLGRTESPTDRRVKVVTLTPQGTAIRQAILQRLSDHNQSYILSKLTEKEVEQFTKLIRKITDGCPQSAMHQAS